MADDSDASKNIFVAANGGVDLEPDAFFYSLPSGESGQFFFDRNGNVKVVEQTPLSYDYETSGDRIISWRITGIDGTDYYFEKYDLSEAANTCKGDSDIIIDVDGNFVTIPDVNAPTSWHLTKMVSASRLDSIMFEYVSEILSYNQTISTTEYDAILGGKGDIETSICSNILTVTGWALSKITASNGYSVEFTRVDDRDDLSGGKELDRIVLKSASSVIKEYELQHTYQNGVFLLTSVKECSWSTPCLPPYQMQYFALDAPLSRTTTSNIMGILQWSEQWRIICSRDDL